MRSIYDLDLKDIENYLLEKGFKPFHGKQIFRWLYDKSINDMEALPSGPPQFPITSGSQNTWKTEMICKTINRSNVALMDGRVTLKNL